jgi:hypothetical protein
VRGSLPRQSQWKDALAAQQARAKRLMLARIETASGSLSASTGGARLAYVLALKVRSGNRIFKM